MIIFFRCLNYQNGKKPFWTKAVSTCINCGSNAENNFCSRCGQKLNPSEISWKNVSSELTEKWVGLDTKFARTVRHLFRKPEAVIRLFLARNTVQYAGPLGYLVVMTALFMLSVELMGLDLEQYLVDMQKNAGTIPDNPSDNQMHYQQLAFHWLARNFRIVAGIMVPFFAVGVWAAYRKRKLSYLEALVATSYVQANSIWISIFFVGVYTVTGVILTAPQALISCVYFVWAVGRTYPGRSGWRTYLRSFFGYLMGYLIFLVSTMVITFLVLLTYGFLKSKGVMG